ncbi:MAG: glyceraldehyde-3-phosphate dehydrogenase [Planktomarina sp.]|nr:glyceraldehyde-3-phosphate dehydrogenase [Planktomarina sp.]
MTITPRLALYVALAAIAAIAADWFLAQGGAILYLARAFLDLIDTIAFWR